MKELCNMARVLSYYFLLLLLCPELVTFVFGAVLRTSSPGTSMDNNLTKNHSEIFEPDNNTGIFLGSTKLNGFSSNENVTDSLNSAEEYANNSSNEQRNSTISLTSGEERSLLVAPSEAPEMDQLEVSDTSASGEENISGHSDQSLEASLADIPPLQDIQNLLNDLEAAIIKTELFELSNGTFELEQSLEMSTDSLNLTEDVMDECSPSTNQNSSHTESNNTFNVRQLPEKCKVSTSTEASYVKDGWEISSIDTFMEELNATETSTVPFSDANFVSETLQPAEESITTVDSLNFESSTSSDLVNSLPAAGPLDIKCPPPGLCILWFLSDDICSSDLHCIGTRICCKVRCSRICIEASWE